MRAPILFAVLIACVLSFQDVEVPAEPERVHLASVYGDPFDTPAQAGVRRVTVTGTVAHDEQVWVALDPNSCTGLGPFGDEGACTEMAGWTRSVRLAQAKVKDPLGRGRKLFLLDDAVLEGRLLLVGAGEDGHGWRLVQRDEEGKVARVLSLERRPLPKHLEEDR